MSNTTISDYHSKAIYDYGLSPIWPEKVLIESKVIEDKFTEIDKTVSFTVSITDSTFTNPIYSLENEPTGATIDSSGQFVWTCLLYTSPSPRDGLLSRMPSSA